MKYSIIVYTANQPMFLEHALMYYSVFSRIQDYEIIVIDCGTQGRKDIVAKDWTDQLIRAYCNVVNLVWVKTNYVGYHDPRKLLLLGQNLAAGKRYVFSDVTGLFDVKDIDERSMPVEKKTIPGIDKFHDLCIAHSWRRISADEV